MLKSLRCHFKGHLYVDSRSQPGTRVCVRCKHRQLFESLAKPPLRVGETGNGKNQQD